MVIGDRTYFILYDFRELFTVLHSDEYAHIETYTEIMLELGFSTFWYHDGPGIFSMSTDEYNWFLLKYA